MSHSIFKNQSKGKTQFQVGLLEDSDDDNFISPLAIKKKKSKRLSGKDLLSIVSHKPNNVVGSAHLPAKYQQHKDSDDSVPKLSLIEDVRTFDKSAQEQMISDDRPPPRAPPPPPPPRHRAGVIKSTPQAQQKSRLSLPRHRQVLSPSSSLSVSPISSRSITTRISTSSISSSSTPLPGEGPGSSSSSSSSSSSTCGDSPSVLRQWMCGSCTMFNDERAPQCSMCDSLRTPSSSLRDSPHTTAFAHDPDITTATSCSNPHTFVNGTTASCISLTSPSPLVRHARSSGPCGHGADGGGGGGGGGGSEWEDAPFSRTVASGGVCHSGGIGVARCENYDHSGSSRDDGEEFPEVPCPKCTFLNPAGSVQCELCECQLAKKVTRSSRQNMNAKAVTSGAESGEPQGSSDVQDKFNGKLVTTCGSGSKRGTNFSSSQEHKKQRGSEPLTDRVKRTKGADALKQWKVPMSVLDDEGHEVFSTTSRGAGPEVSGVKTLSMISNGGSRLSISDSMQQSMNTEELHVGRVNNGDEDDEAVGELNGGSSGEAGLYDSAGGLRVRGPWSPQTSSDESDGSGGDDEMCEDDEDDDGKFSWDNNSHVIDNSIKVDFRQQFSGGTNRGVPEVEVPRSASVGEERSVSPPLRKTHIVHTSRRASPGGFQLITGSRCNDASPIAVGRVVDLTHFAGAATSSTMDADNSGSAKDFLCDLEESETDLSDTDDNDDEERKRKAGREDNSSRTERSGGRRDSNTHVVEDIWDLESEHSSDANVNKGMKSELYNNNHSGCHRHNSDESIVHESIYDNKRDRSRYDHGDDGAHEEEYSVDDNDDDDDDDDGDDDDDDDDDEVEFIEQRWQSFDEGCYAQEDDDDINDFEDDDNYDQRHENSHSLISEHFTCIRDLSRSGACSIDFNSFILQSTCKRLSNSYESRQTARDKKKGKKSTKRKSTKRKTWKKRK